MLLFKKQTKQKKKQTKKPLQVHTEEKSAKDVPRKF